MGGMDEMLQRAQRYSGKWVWSLVINTDRVCGSLTLAGSLFEDEIGPFRLGCGPLAEKEKKSEPGLLFHQNLRPGKILIM